MKSKVGKLDIGKLESTPVDLITLSNVVKNEVVKKTAYDELVKKVNNFNTSDTSDLVKKKQTITQKLIKLKKKIQIMITTNILLLKDSIKQATLKKTATLKQANLASKNYIANFIKKTDFTDKLKKLIKKLTSNKTRHIEVKTKLYDLEKQ